MNKLSTTKRAQVIAALVEGAGINSVCRMTGVGKPTVLRLLENLGKACHKAYLEAVWNSFGCEIDYAMLVKLYNHQPTGNETRYSPAVCCGTRKTKITGDPDKKHVSTSFSERLNLQLRMSNRRFTRLTNAHSKKIDNHIYSMAIYTMYYNFVRIHSSLRVTPAVEAGVAQHVWSLEEMIGLMN